MRALGSIVSLVFLVTLTGCAPRSDRISQAWVGQWVERHATYEAEAERLTGAHDTRKTDLFEVASAEPSGDDLQRSLVEYFQALYAAAQAQARLVVLSNFLDYWEGAPTRGMVATWLEDKARIFNEESRSWEKEKAAFLSREPSAENILPASDLTLKQGTLVGMGDEVLRLSRETKVFLAELDVAAQADALAWQRFGAGLQQMGQAMQSAGDRQQDILFQQQLLHELRRPQPSFPSDVRLRTVCQQIGTMTFCN